MKQTYIRCPRCELNFILKRDRFCNVCKKEMKALGSMGSDEDFDLELCPVCKVNYINSNEDMCAICAKEKALSDDDDKDEKHWDAYTEPEDDDAGYSDEETSDMVSITNLDDDSLEIDDDVPLSLADDDEEELEEDMDESDVETNDDDDFFDDEDDFDDDLDSDD